MAPYPRIIAHRGGGALAPENTLAGIAIAAAGIPLACYTVNRRGEADRLFNAGVSAVFTDRPDLWAQQEM